jgi:yecA family protein
MTPSSLTDAEFDRLSSVLERFGNQRSMNLEQLDGFLAALVCCPDNVPPSEYLPEIWGDNIVLEDTFAAQPIFVDFISLIMRHWNAIVHTLRSGDVHLPLLLPDEDGIAHANDWATGFMRGMELSKEDWGSLLNDEEHGGWIIPILALAHEHDPDPAMRPYPVFAVYQAPASLKPLNVQFHEIRRCSGKQWVKIIFEDRVSDTTVGQFFRNIIFRGSRAFRSISGDPTGIGLNSLYLHLSDLS